MDCKLYIKETSPGGWKLFQEFLSKNGVVSDYANHDTFGVWCRDFDEHTASQFMELVNTQIQDRNFRVRAFMVIQEVAA